MNRRTHSPSHGFTLIELMIVIAIIGLLAAVLLPEILGTKKKAAIKACSATMLEISTGITGFSRKNGYFPSDDLSGMDTFKNAGWKPDNGINTGIESLVCFLSQSVQSGGADLSGHADTMVNTDGDDNGVELPLLHRRDRVELADPWNTPFVYFSKLGMDRAQRVKVDAESDVVQVKAMRRADGTPYGAGKFQLLSAGPDRIFGTADDVVYPDN